MAEERLYKGNQKGTDMGTLNEGTKVQVRPKSDIPSLIHCLLQLSNEAPPHTLCNRDKRTVILSKRNVSQWCLLVPVPDENLCMVSTESS